MRGLLVGLGAVLLMADGASAATVSLQANTDEDSDSALGAVVFRGSPGEASELTVTIDTNDRLVFRDASNRIRVAGHCALIAADTARCDYTEEGAVLRLGGGDDTARNRVRESRDVTMSVTTLGGPGKDTLVGAPVFDAIDGGPGNDTVRGRGSFDILTGGPGRDRLVGGGGSDELVDGESDDEVARDVYVGGAQDRGRKGDLLTYRGRSAAVTVSLADPADNEDDLRDVESLAGGAGNDRLAGDDRANTLNGARGDDRMVGDAGKDRLVGGEDADDLYGHNGNDVVDGGKGSDQLAGGADDDTVRTRNDGTDADAVACGDGADVIDSDPVDTAATDCEEFRFSFSDLSALTLPTLEQSEATFSIAYDDNATITLTDPIGQLGTTNFKLNDSENKQPVEVPLNRPIAAPTLVTVAYSYNDESFGGYTMMMGGP